MPAEREGVEGGTGERHGRGSSLLHLQERCGATGRLQTLSKSSKQSDPRLSPNPARRREESKKKKKKKPQREGCCMPSDQTSPPKQTASSLARRLCRLDDLVDHARVGELHTGENRSARLLGGG